MDRCLWSTLFTQYRGVQCYGPIDESIACVLQGLAQLGISMLQCSSLLSHHLSPALHIEQTLTCSGVSEISCWPYIRDCETALTNCAATSVHEHNVLPSVDHAVLCLMTDQATKQPSLTQLKPFDCHGQNAGPCSGCGVGAVDVSGSSARNCWIRRAGGIAGKPRALSVCFYFNNQQPWLKCRKHGGGRWCSCRGVREQFCS